MATMSELAGSRIVAAGRKDAEDVLDLDKSDMLLWLIEGEAQWVATTGKTEILQAKGEIHELTGPGTLRFVTHSHYLQLESGDKLGFDARAGAYRAVMETHNENVGLALAEGLPMKSGQIWVDVGTGTGAMVHALQKRSGHKDVWIVGIDQASKMIDEAWRHQSDNAPAWYVGQDLLAVKWPEAMIDGITALLLLHLIDDVDLLVNRLYRSLKPGGLFAYAVSVDSNPFVRMIMHQLSGPGGFFKQGQQSIRKSVLSAGFEIVREDTYRDEIVMGSPEAMLQLIGSIGAPSQRGVRTDVLPPTSVERIFHLVWVKKPINAF